MGEDVGDGFGDEVGDGFGDGFGDEDTGLGAGDDVVVSPLVSPVGESVPGALLPAEKV